LIYFDDQFWRKKKDLPNKCPGCGTVKHETKGKPTLDSLFNDHFNNLHHVKIYDKKWKMEKWVLDCSYCDFIDTLTKPSIFEKMLKNDWQGSSPRKDDTVKFSFERF